MRASSRPAADRLPRATIVGLGFGLLTAVCWHLYATHVHVVAAEPTPAGVALEAVELGLLLVPSAAMLAFGYRMPIGDLPPRYRWTVARWCVAGFAGLAAVVAALKLHRYVLGYGLRPAMAQMEFLTAAGVGGVLGLGIGWERANHRVQTVHVESQRDAFLFVNRLLRHHVLNGVQIIDGYAAKLGRESDPDTQRIRDVVRTRSDAITTLVEDVRTIVRTFTGDAEVGPVDLGEVVQSALDDVRRANPDAEVRTDVPESVYVRSNALLSVVFEQLFDNAVRHNDAPSPRLTVTVETREAAVRTHVADDGPGIPEASKSALTEPGETGDRGAGLYLAHRVVTEHGGDLTIADNDPTGTVVTVELPRAAPPEGSGPDATEDTHDQ